MTKKKLAIIASSSLGLFMVAALTVGVVYKWNKSNEYNAYLEQQTASQPQDPAPVVVTPAEPIKVPAIKSESKAKPVTSAPEIVVSTDESGNQTITPEWTKPETPTEEELHNPNVNPGTSSSTPQTSNKPNGTPQTPNKPSTPKDNDVKYDGNGNQIPNAKGEVYVPGFGWIADSGPNKTETAHNAGTGDVIGY